MKELVLVEAAPWRTKENLLKLRHEGINLKKILFFTKSKDVPDEYRVELLKLEKELRIGIVRIGTSDFSRTLDEYYDRKNIFVLSAMDLEGRNFEERINVRYANSKKNKGKGKIWFYTTGGKDFKAMLVQNFENQVIDVEGFYGNQVFWNESQILQIAKGMI